MENTLQNEQAVSKTNRGKHIAAIVKIVGFVLLAVGCTLHLGNNLLTPLMYRVDVFEALLSTFGNVIRPVYIILELIAILVVAVGFFLGARQRKISILFGIALVFYGLFIFTIDAFYEVLYYIPYGDFHDFIYPVLEVLDWIIYTPPWYLLILSVDGFIKKKPLPGAVVTVIFVIGTIFRFIWNNISLPEFLLSVRWPLPALFFALAAVLYCILTRKDK